MAEFTETKTYSVTCPKCQSARVIKAGQQNGQQRYSCKECKKWFRANGIPEGRRVPAEQMGMAIRMFYSGLSYKQIAETMADAFDIPEPSKATVYEWVRDYTDEASRILEHPDFKAQTGDEWVADEMQVVVGGEKYWNWNVMDAKTRFILASYLSKHRGLRDAETVMEMASEVAEKHPKTIKTDRLGSYPNAINLVFPYTKHVQSDGIRALINNNLSERLQGTFRQRTKTMRGLDSRETGQRYLDGWVLTYNFFREHEALDDRTPAEAAKVSPPFRDWADVVRGKPHPKGEERSTGSGKPPLAATLIKPNIKLDALPTVKLKERTPAPKMKALSKPKPASRGKAVIRQKPKSPAVPKVARRKVA